VSYTPLGSPDLPADLPAEVHIVSSFTFCHLAHGTTALVIWLS
jgi:hypothetical protein